MISKCVLVSVICGLGVVGTLVLIIGIVLQFYGNSKIIDYVIDKESRLNNGSEALQRFIKLPQPIYLKVYIYNVTNPDEVHEGGLPKLNEIGPYYYDQYREKINFTMNDTAGTASFYLKKTFVFNKKKSGPGLSDSDTVTMLNVVLYGAAVGAEVMMPAAVGYINDAVPQLFSNPSTVFTTAKLSDFLFDGLLMNCTTDDYMVKMICGAMENQLPDTVRKEDPDYYFSFFSHLNKTGPNLWTIDSGLRRPQAVNDIIKYDEFDNFEVWENFCNIMNGSDGMQFSHMRHNHTQRIYVFEPDFCLSLYADFEKEGTFRHIAETNRYAVTEKLLAKPEAGCFCFKQEENRMCPEPGTINLLPCTRAPIIISFPHFLFAGKSIAEYSNLSPAVPHLHETFAEIEKNTGFPVNASKRIQFNMQIRPIEGLVLTDNLTQGLLPILWIDEGYEIHGELWDLFSSKLGLLGFIHTGTYVIIALGFIALITGIVIIGKNQNIYYNSSQNIRSNCKVDIIQDDIMGTYKEKMKQMPLFYPAVNKGSFSYQPDIDITRKTTYTTAYMEHFM